VQALAAICASLVCIVQAPRNVVDVPAAESPSVVGWLRQQVGMDSR